MTHHPCRTEGCHRAAGQQCHYCKPCLDARRDLRAALPPVCEVCRDRFAVGPHLQVCSPCYTEFAPRAAHAARFRDPLRGGLHCPRPIKSA